MYKASLGYCKMCMHVHSHMKPSGIFSPCVTGCDLLPMEMLYTRLYNYTSSLGYSSYTSFKLLYIIVVINIPLSCTFDHATNDHDKSEQGSITWLLVEAWLLCKLSCKIDEVGFHFFVQTDDKVHGGMFLVSWRSTALAPEAFVVTVPCMST